MIRFDKVNKRFGSVQACSNISLHAPDGQITGVLGPNGAGKTTALRCLLGLVKPDSGQVEVDEFRVADNPQAARSRLGVLPDQFGLYVRLTAREHLAYFGRLHGLHGAALDAAVEDVAARIGMTELLPRRVQGFSQGERMKVALGRALLHNPRNLVLDEPTRGLDVMAARTLRELLANERAEGRCIVFSSHVMAEVAALCDRVVIIAQGRVTAEGSPAELCDQAGEPELEDAFVKLIGTTRGLAA